MRRFLEEALSPHFEVFSASDGEDALQRIAVQRPDLVVSDVRMPRLDGIGLVKRIRTTRALSDLPVILFSGELTEESAVEIFEAGADDFLVKPIHPFDVVARSRSRLKLAAARKGAGFGTPSIIDHLPGGILELDLEGRLLWANAAWFEMLGYTQEQLPRLKLEDLLEPACQESAAAMIASFAAGSLETGSLELGFQREEGPVFWSITRFRVIPGDGRETRRLVALVTAQSAVAGTDRHGEFLSDLIGNVTTAGLDRDIIRASLAATGARLGADRCFFIECKEGETSLTVSEHWTRQGTAPNLAGIYEAPAPGELDGWEEDAQEPISDLLSRFQERGGSDVGEDFRSWTVQSFAAGDGRIVLLVAATSQPRAWTGEDRELMERVLATVWPAVERARIEREREIELDNLRHLQELSAQLIHEGDIVALFKEIVQAAVSVTEADLGVLQLFEPLNNQLRLLSALGFAEPILEALSHINMDSAFACAEAARLKERIIVSDDAMSPDAAEWRPYFEAGVQALQCTPLLTRSGELAGVISTFWRQDVKPGESQLRVLDVLARQAADLIEVHLHEQELRKNEEEFRASFQASGVGKAQADPASARLLRVNRKLCQLLQYSEEELTQKTLFDLTHPDQLRHCEELFGQLQSGECAELSMEKQMFRKDGSLIWAQVNTVMLRDPKGQATRAMVVIQDITARREAEEALRQARDELEERIAERTDELQQRADQLARLTSQLTLVEQGERLRISRLLHDLLQQDLVSIQMRLDRWFKQEEPPPRDELGDSKSLVEKCIALTRDLSVQLYPPSLQESGLGAALEELAMRMEDKHGLTVELALDEEAVVEREDVRIILFESIREALFNVVKHSGVNRAEVILGLDEDQRVQVIVQDSGRGFAIESGAEGPASSGLGLVAMKERLATMGGRLEIESLPGKGTTVTLLGPPARAGEEGPAPEARRNEAGCRILLVDDHCLVRSGLARLLNSEPGLEVVGEASRGEEAIEKCEQLLPDLVLLDYGLPDLSGLEVCRVLHERWPSLAIIGLSQDERHAESMLGSGASSFLPKSGEPNVLLDKIRELQPRQNE